MYCIIQWENVDKKACQFNELKIKSNHSCHDEQRGVYIAESFVEN